MPLPRQRLVRYEHQFAMTGQRHVVRRPDGQWADERDGADAQTGSSTPSRNRSTAPAKPPATKEAAADLQDRPSAAADGAAPKKGSVEVKAWLRRRVAAICDTARLGCRDGAEAGEAPNTAWLGPRPEPRARGRSSNPYVVQREAYPQFDEGRRYLPVAN